MSTWPCPSFNGATLMHSVEDDRDRGGVLADAIMLQWGHADVSVEDLDPGSTDLRASVQSFNGATLMHSVEDASSRGLPSRPMHALQWGHADARRGRRERRRRSDPRRPARFNGATLMPAWKTLRFGDVDRVHESASMGPRRCTAWKTARIVRGIERSRSRFNGATPMYGVEDA